MWQKISRRRFIDVMTSHRNLLIEWVFGYLDLEEFASKSRMYSGFYCDREVTAVRSNHLEFSDDSRLYFDGRATRTYREYVGDGWTLLSIEVQEPGLKFPKNLVYLVK